MPEIGVAAFEVLDAAGHRQRRSRRTAAADGRSSRRACSSEARDLAARQRRRAASTPPPRGEAIVFVEPSCLSAMREDAPALLRGERSERARVVARAVVLFEEYLERELAAGRATLPLAAGPADVLLASALSPAVDGPGRAGRRRCCRGFPGATVTDLDAGCCGMAGSFGYTREHYDVSQAIGERKLLPAARALRAGAVLAAAGTSCRHQVAHFTGVRRRASGRPAARSLAGGALRMNLAWISLAALVIAVTLSMVTKVNVGVVSLALAWIVGVYLGGMPLNTVIGTFPVQLFLTLAGVTLLFGMANVNGTLRPPGGARRARLPRQRRRHPGDVLRGGARASRASAPATSRPRRSWRRWRWRSARRPRCRRS